MKATIALLVTLLLLIALAGYHDSWILGQRIQKLTERVEQLERAK